MPVSNARSATRVIGSTLLWAVRRLPQSGASMPGGPAVVTLLVVPRKGYLPTANIRQQQPPCAAP